MIKGFDQKIRFNAATRASVKDYIDERVDNYYQSSCYRKLCSRMMILNEHVDLLSPGVRTQTRNQNIQNSKLIVPLVREVFDLRFASLAYNFRNPPLISVRPDGDTSLETAVNMHNTLATNFNATKFMSRDFYWIKHDVSRWGSAVSVSRWEQHEKRQSRTIVDPILGYSNKRETRAVGNCWNRRLSDPRNYFQNEGCPDPHASDFRGHFDRITVAELIADVKRNESVYYRDVLRKIIAKAKQSALDDDRYSGPAKRGQMHSYTLDRMHWLGQVRIKGNEEDQQNYYCEMIDGEIVRFELNPYDFDLINYTVWTMQPRYEYWWGNVDTEPQIALEQHISMVFNMQFQSALQALKQMVFVEAGSVDQELLARAHQGGIVPIRTKPGMPIQNMLFPFQNRNIALQDLESVYRQTKEFSDRAKPQTDLSRPAAQGGPSNRTLGGAMMMQNRGNMVESNYLECFAYALEHLGYCNTTILQQMMPDIFSVRPDARMQQQTLRKSDILGTYSYKIETSLTKNQIEQSNRLQNVLMAMMNLVGTGHPAFQRLNPEPIVKELVRHLDLPGDVNEVYPEAPPQLPQPQPQQMMPQQGAGAPPPAGSSPSQLPAPNAASMQIPGGAG